MKLDRPGAGRVPACIVRGLAGICLAAAILPLAGCGGVEFQGKIFDYAGLSGDRKQDDVKMSERGPLVIPPSATYLPPPGSGAAQPAVANWPTNPETTQQEVANAQGEAERKRAAANDPLNPYAGKQTMLDRLFSRKKVEEDPAVAAVPTPDPADGVGPVNGGTRSASSGNYKPPAATGTAAPEPEAADPFHQPPPSTYDSMSGRGGYQGS